MISTENRVKIIENKLTQALQPTQLIVNDDSAHHADHAGASSGAGHFSLFIVSLAFKNKTLIQRHRMVYDVLEDLLKHDIHALQINAKSPDELK